MNVGNGMLLEFQCAKRAQPLLANGPEVRGSLVVAGGPRIDAERGTQAGEVRRATQPLAVVGCLSFAGEATGAENKPGRFAQLLVALGGAHSDGPAAEVGGQRRVVGREALANPDSQTGTVGRVVTHVTPSTRRCAHPGDMARGGRGIRPALPRLQREGTRSDAHLKTVARAKGTRVYTALDCPSRAGSLVHQDAMHDTDEGFGFGGNVPR